MQNQQNERPRGEENHNSILCITIATKDKLALLSHSNHSFICVVWVRTQPQPRNSRVKVALEVILSKSCVMCTELLSPTIRRGIERIVGLSPFEYGQCVTKGLYLNL